MSSVGSVGGQLSLALLSKQLGAARTTVAKGAQAQASAPTPEAKQAAAMESLVNNAVVGQQVDQYA
jgi:hypothetical protein